MYGATRLRDRIVASRFRPVAAPSPTAVVTA
jgi:hypothetical protein